jgi:tRNA U34 5-methylaminomethyl-2-thiouridine-forming methyltransferase MnmC
MLRIIRTEDGSQSLFDEELNETYHSTKGAQTESEYVFLKMGLNEVRRQYLVDSPQTIRVLEVGFGTGLNAWLSWKWAEEHKIPIHFYTLEPFPISAELVSEMDLSSDEYFQAVHKAEWNKTTVLGEYSTLEKSTKKLEEAELPHSFDCVFFDAFAPSKQPEVWSLENLQKCFEALKPGGILTSYCAQGQFKRNMATVGFEVEVLPGALGKKEMVRGRKPI